MIDFYSVREIYTEFLMDLRAIVYVLRGEGIFMPWHIIECEDVKILSKSDGGLFAAFLVDFFEKIKKIYDEKGWLCAVEALDEAGCHEVKYKLDIKMGAL